MAMTSSVISTSHVFIGSEAASETTDMGRLLFSVKQGSALCKLKSSELDKMLMSRGSLHRCSAVFFCRHSADNFRASVGSLLEFPLSTLILVASLSSSLEFGKVVLQFGPLHKSM